MFTDYERQKNYIPDLKKSSISKRISSTIVQIDYKLKMPWPLSDEDYTVEDSLSAYDGNKHFRVDWKRVRADTTKDIRGYVQFETLGTGTIMLYENFVVPGSSLSGMFKDKAIRAIRDTAKEIVKQIQVERVRNPELLSIQVQTLRQALGL